MCGPPADQVSVLACDLDDGTPPRIVVCTRRSGAPRAALIGDEVVTLIDQGRVDLHDPGSGERVGGCVLPTRASEVHGRFLLCGRRWVALRIDGRTAALTDVCGIDHAGHDRVLTVCDGESGPRLLTASGRFFTRDGPLRSRAPLPEDRYRLIGRSHDGTRVCVDGHSGGGRSRFVVHLHRAWCQRWGSAWDLEPGITRRLNGLDHALHDISDVGAAGAGSGLLVRLRGSSVFLVSPWGDHFGLRAREEPTPETLHPLTGAKRPRGSWSERRAIINGVRVRVDARGLLHLARDGRPELTIVLCPGPTAAWSSDGHCQGRESLLVAPSGDPAALTALLRAYVDDLA